MNQVALSRSDTAVLVVDVQDRLCAAMEPSALTRMVARTWALLEGARALGLPVAFSEQYPKGLGPTRADLLAAAPGTTPVEKLRFSAALPPVLALLGECKQVLVAGMETHICVFQTARDLSRLGLSPLVCADAVLSRSEEDRRVGLDLCRDAGARIVTVESALFDLLGEAGTQEFKAVSRAVK